MSADMRPEVIDREGFASQSGSPAGNSAGRAERVPYRRVKVS